MAKVEIPLELITEILIRLPVKPLFRFKCVSKSWNSLISSPSFVTRHFKSNPNLNLIFTPRKPAQSFFSALIHDDINDNYTDFHLSEFKHPFKFNDNYACVVDSSNGILLISDFHKKTFFLYNPANNTYRPIPSIRSRNGESFGFGYDSHSDDYKVVRVVQNRYVNLEMYVYSMRENVWKFIKDESNSVNEHILHQGNGVCANGVLYFRARNFTPSLMCFDLRTESVSILDFPEGYDYLRVSTSLSELRGCLSLIVNTHSWSREILHADVWEIREDGKEALWVKLFRMRNNELVGKDEPACMNLRLVAYSKDKGKVLVEVDGGLVVWYDLVTKRAKEVKTHGLREEYSPYGVMTYVESLFSLGNVKVVSVSVSKGGSTPKKTVDSKNMHGFLSKGFKLKL